MKKSCYINSNGYTYIQIMHNTIYIKQKGLKWQLSGKDMYNLDFIYKHSAYNPVTQSSAEVHDLTPHAQDKDSTKSY